MTSEAMEDLLIDKMKAELMGVAMFAAEARGGVETPDFHEGSCSKDAYSLACTGIVRKDAENTELREEHNEEIRRLADAHAKQVADMKSYQEHQALSITSYDDRLRRALKAIEDCPNAEVRDAIIKAHGGQRSGNKVGMSGSAHGASAIKLGG